MQAPSTVHSTATFPHERLLAYARALAFRGFVVGVKDRLPRGTGDTYDQLYRAANSIVLNIAEGAAAYLPGDKRRHLRIALASAGECAAALDLLAQEAPEAMTDAQAARGTLVEAAALTVGLIRRL